MTYTQIKANVVFAVITQGFNVIICDFRENKILYTNELTVETIRNYIAQSDVAFFKVEETTANA